MCCRGVFDETWRKSCWECGSGSDREGYDEVNELGMDESHFELEEVDGERRCPEVVVVCACRSGSCAAGRVVKEELDGDKS